MTDAKGTKRALITPSTVECFQQTSGKTERQAKEERVNDAKMRQKHPVFNCCACFGVCIFPVQIKAVLQIDEKNAADEFNRTR